MLKNYIKIFLVILVFDILISSLFLKNTIYWENYNWNKKFWRIQSEIYHHDLMANIDVKEKWGDLLEYRIITNSLGFRDNSKRKIAKTSNKKRVLLIGDSFIEGSGLEYNQTFSGLLQKYLGENYEVLNAGVASYSPSIYYAKANHLILEGYKFDQALVFLDVSDVYDELYLKFDNKGKILSDKNNKNLKKNKNFVKQKIYKFGNFLRDNTVTFRLFYLISDKTEVLKNYLKLKYKASVENKKKFFKTNREDVLFYRMTHVDRGFWTVDNKKYDFVREGVKKSDEKLKRLFKLLKDNSIKSSLVIYPWPTQILFGDNKHEPYWINFSNENQIDLINLYNIFSNKNKKFILKNFINGDIHWNESGTKLVFNEVVKNFNF